MKEGRVMDGRKGEREIGWILRALARFVSGFAIMRAWLLVRKMDSRKGKKGEINLVDRRSKPRSKIINRYSIPCHTVIRHTNPSSFRRVHYSRGKNLAPNPEEDKKDVARKSREFVGMPQCSRKFTNQHRPTGFPKFGRG